MEYLTIDEIIAHCDRVLEKHTSGTTIYQEHESVRHHLQVLRHYLNLELPLFRLEELIEAMKVNHLILTPFAVGQPVYFARNNNGEKKYIADFVKKVYIVEHIDIYDEDCPVYYCVNPDNSNDRYCFDGDEIGDAVFATPAEADAAQIRKENEC